MDALFCCRNCVHNCGQSLNIGQGAGYCLQHNSLIENPDDTTCKYLHRKDLPHFVVQQGLEEHAAEYVRFSALATLSTREPIPKVRYSQRYVWENRAYDPLVQMSAQYHKFERAWVLIEWLSGGVDGRRSLAHASLVRRYMDHCGTWRSSYRLVLELVQELSVQPQFAENALLLHNGDDYKLVAAEALWDVVFSRLGAVQEYGWHAGLEELMWATESLNGALVTLNWSELQPQLLEFAKVCTDRIIEHAKSENQFFPPMQEAVSDDE